VLIAEEEKIIVEEMKGDQTVVEEKYVKLFRLLLVIMHSEMMSLSGQLSISDEATKVKPPLGPMFLV